MRTTGLSWPSEETTARVTLGSVTQSGRGHAQRPRGRAVRPHRPAGQGQRQQARSGRRPWRGAGWEALLRGAVFRGDGVFRSWAGWAHGTVGARGPRHGSGRHGEFYAVRPAPSLRRRNEEKGRHRQRSGPFRLMKRSASGTEDPGKGCGTRHREVKRPALGHTGLPGAMRGACHLPGQGAPSGSLTPRGARPPPCPRRPGRTQV